MTCTECKELISAFLDDDLAITVAADVRDHLALCIECAEMCREFAMLVDFSSGEDAAEFIPNSDALWRRIHNLVETESDSLAESESESRPSWIWQLSLSQVVAAVFGIALVSSLVTVIGLRNLAEPAGMQSSEPSFAQSVVNKVFGNFGLVETAEQVRERRIRERQKAIDYWSKRVAVRRAEWDERLRQTFDRNLREIDQVVFEYDRMIKQNPHDKLTGELLDSAMAEKMELLREFSEL